MARTTKPSEARDVQKWEYIVREPARPCENIARGHLILVPEDGGRLVEDVIGVEETVVDDDAVVPNDVWESRGALR
jgi:hypothetical protein